MYHQKVQLSKEKKGVHNFKIHVYMYIKMQFAIWYKKWNRKVQEEPHAEAAAHTRNQEEEKKWHRLTYA